MIQSCHKANSGNGFLKPKYKEHVQILEESLNGIENIEANKTKVELSRMCVNPFRQEEAHKYQEVLRSNGVIVATNEYTESLTYIQNNRYCND